MEQKIIIWSNPFQEEMFIWPNNFTLPDIGDYIDYDESSWVVTEKTYNPSNFTIHIGVSKV